MPSEEAMRRLKERQKTNQNDTPLTEWFYQYYGDERNESAWLAGFRHGALTTFPLHHVGYLRTTHTTLHKDECKHSL